MKAVAAWIGAVIAAGFYLYIGTQVPLFGALVLSVLVSAYCCWSVEYLIRRFRKP